MKYLECCLAHNNHSMTTCWSFFSTKRGGLIKQMGSALEDYKALEDFYSPPGTVRRTSFLLPQRKCTCGSRDQSNKVPLRRKKKRQKKLKHDISKILCLCAR